MLNKSLVVLASVISLAASSLVVAPTSSALDVSIVEPTRLVWHPTDPNIAYVATDFDNFELGKTITKVDFSTTPATLTDLVTMSDTIDNRCHTNVNTLAITPDASTLYAGGYSCVMRIDLANPAAYVAGYTGQGWVQQIAVGSDAAYAIHAEQGAVYKAVKTGATWGSSWSVLVPAQFAGPVSRGGALSNDGSTLYVTNENGGTNLRQINTLTGAEGSVAGTGPGLGIAVDPKDGAYALIINGERQIIRLDLTGANAGTVTATASTSERRLRDISIDADGAFAYVVADVDKTLLKINPADLTVVNRYTFPSTAGDVAASPIRGNDSVLLSMPGASTLLRLPAPPKAPASVTAAAGDESATLSFTEGQDGFASITNYEYRLDGSGAWTPLSPADTSSPVTVSGLTNGTPVAIELRAVNSVGEGSASASVNVTPEYTPGVPRSVNVSAGSRQVSISFTAPTSDGGRAITNYEYSLNGGSTWTALSPASTTSPIVIPGLTNGTSYQVSLRAVNSLGAGASSTPVGVTPGDPSTGGSAPEPAATEPTPSPTPSPSASSVPTSSPTPLAVPEPVAVGEGLVVVDGRVSKIAVLAVEGRKWQVKGEDFTLEFTPRADLGQLDGSFTAKAGTTVDVRGDGFVPGSLIATYLPGASSSSLGEANVGSDGTFEVTATFPASLSAGQYVFQVNGLASATSVRSVNLGLELLAADVTTRSSVTKRVTFAKGSADLGAKARSAIARFADDNGQGVRRALLVPAVYAADGSDARLLARKRAEAVRRELRENGFAAPIRISAKSRKMDPKATRPQAILVMQFQRQ